MDPEMKIVVAAVAILAILGVAYVVVRRMRRRSTTASAREAGTAAAGISAPDAALLGKLEQAMERVRHAGCQANCGNKERLIRLMAWTRDELADASPSKEARLGEMLRILLPPGERDHC